MKSFTVLVLTILLSFSAVAFADYSAKYTTEFTSKSVNSAQTTSSSKTDEDCEG